MQRSAPRRLVSTSSHQSSASTSQSGPIAASVPALLTSRSSRPELVARPWRLPLSTAAAVAHVCAERAAQPSSPAARSSSSSASVPRARPARPPRESARAIARPTPRAPPVTIAVCPASSGSWSHLRRTETHDRARIVLGRRSARSAPARPGSRRAPATTATANEVAQQRASARLRPRPRPAARRASASSRASSAIRCVTKTIPRNKQHLGHGRVHGRRGHAVRRDRREVRDDVLDRHDAVDDARATLAVAREQQHAGNMVEGVEDDRRREQGEHSAPRRGSPFRRAGRRPVSGEESPLRPRTAASRRPRA